VATTRQGVMKAGVARLRGIDSRIVGYVFVLLAAALWGSLGIIYNTLNRDYGVPIGVTVFYRAFFAALGLLVYLGLRNRGLLVLPRRQLPLLLGYALLGITVFYSVYGQSTITNTVAVAAVLMYTAPAFVILFARFWGEPLTRRKLGALLLTFVGCALVAQVYAAGQLNFNWLGLALGLGSGVLYASYTIFANQGLRNGLAPLTVVFYAQAFGAVGLLTLVVLSSGGFGSVFAAGPHWQAWLLLLTAGLFNTLAAAGFYVSGLARIETGAASIASTFELVCATAFGFIFLAQAIDIWQALGGTLVIAALVLLARK
jgi:drug/metabolite transporter, DME family